MTTLAVDWVLSSVVAAFGALWFYVAAGALERIPRERVPTVGVRGLSRRKAAESALFRGVEPLISQGAGVVRVLLAWVRRRAPKSRRTMDRLVEALGKALVHAGQPAGFEAHGLLFVMVALSLGGAVACVALRATLGVAVPLVPVAVGCFFLPVFRVQALATERCAVATREIPLTIELLALAMGAGSDFPGAVRKVTEGQVGVVPEEFGHLLDALSLGITRESALRALAERLVVTEVRDLVRAVTLAEKKGSSVAEALRQLADSSRQRRSVRAEEAAARAAVLLLIPMMLLLGCVLILLLAPLLVGGVGL